MSFKKNIIANYASQIYMSLAGILILPLYLKYMGPECYGLVGFFATLQSWFNILDLGLSPSISRETARLRAGVMSTFAYRELMRALQLLFFILMLVGGGALFFLAPYITHSWLKVHNLPLQEVKIAVQLMAISVALRWMCSFYRATLIGAEEFVWISYYTWIFTSLRYLGVLLILIYVGTTASLFFTYQILVSFFELSMLANKALKSFPKLRPFEQLSWKINDLIAITKPIIPFAISISVTSSIWIVITQTDKLILSKLLSLTEYGYYTLGVLAASGVMLFSAPFSMVLMPRLAKLKAEGDDSSLNNLYRQSTRLVACIIIPACFILALFPEQILWLWTSNLTVAHATAPILKLYALGNTALAFATFPYYLQYAHGNMRLHLIGNSVFACLLIPSIIWATQHYGMIGAARVWFIANLCFFLLWTTIVHLRLIKKMHWQWLFKDIAVVFLLSLILITALEQVFNFDSNKLSLFLKIAFIGIVTSGINLIVMNYSYLQKWFITIPKKSPNY